MTGQSLFTIQQAADYLQCSKEGLRKWEREGKIKSLRTPGNHRRYSLYELEKITQSPESNRFIGKFNTFTYSEAEVEGLVEFIKRNAKSGIIVTIEKA